MKWKLAFALLIFINGFAFSQITLDRAVSEAAKELDTRLEPGTVVAMVHFNTDSERMAKFVIEEMHKHLVKTSILKVVERVQIDLITAEHNFQMSGYVSDETVQGIGHMLGAESIINGSIEQIGKVYRFRIQAMDVKTAQVQASYSANVENDQLAAGLMGVSADLSGLSDYTPTERLRAFKLNLIPFCNIGSFMMQDYLGGILGLGLQAIGFALCGTGSFMEKPRPSNIDPSAEYYELTPAGAAMLGVGLGLMASGYLIGLARPYSAHKKSAKTAAISIENLGICFIPNGEESKVLLSYRMCF